MKSTIKKIIAVATALTVSVWLIGPGVAQAVTAQDLQDQIDALLATLDDLQDQLQAMTGEPPTVEGCLVTSFDRNLKQGMSGDDVNCLQIVLNSDSDTQLAASGVGSSGNETSYFGPLTKRGVIKFQEKYTEEILIPLNLTSGTGFVGYLTRVKLNTFLSPTFPAPPPTAPPADTTGPTVTILAPSKGATVSGAVNFQVSATDESGIQVVYFYIDDAEVSLDSTSPYQYSWNTTAYSNGSHKLSAKALDGADNQGTVADTNYTVNVDNAIPSEADTTGPTVTILSPSKGATVKDTVNFQVSATDDSGIQMVYFYIDDAEVFSDSTSPYQYNWDTTAYSNGSHKLSTKALDGADNLGSIADTNYTVNVDNPDPLTSAPPPDPVVTVPAGDVEEFTDPLVLWSFAPHRRYCRSTYDQAMRDCMNPQGRLPTDHWEIGQLSLEYWGMFSAYVMEVTYQGPGGTYFFGPQVTAGPVGQGGEDILYSRYPTPVYFPPSPTPKRFTFYLTGGKQTNIPSGAMRDVVARRQGVFDLTICFYKDIKPPDGLTPWQIWIPWDKVVSYWTWPDVIEYY